MQRAMSTQHIYDYARREIVMQAAKVTLVSAVLLAISVSGGWVYAAENSKDTYDYRTECPSPAGGKMKRDKWLFWKCECTSYAASKLNQRGVKFSNSYKGVQWGNASNWKNAAQQAKITVNNTPARGSIAWFSYGHVAYIETDKDKDGYITISEYNVYPYDYDSRRIKATSVNSFLHVK